MSGRMSGVNLIIKEYLYYKHYYQPWNCLMPIYTAAKTLDLDQVRLSRVRGIGRARCNNAGKFEGEDGLGSPASAPNLPTRFCVGNTS
jgi:hypothetical protein